MSKRPCINLAAGVATVAAATMIATSGGAAPAVYGKIVSGCVKPSRLPNGVRLIVLRNGRAYFSDDPAICGEEKPAARKIAKAKPAPRTSMSGGIYNKTADETTTMIAGKNGTVRTVDKGKVDRLGDMPRRTKSGRASGSSYNPDTGKTTIASAGPNGAASTVEDGNTMNRHNRPRKPLNGAYGAVYDPKTNKTTTIIDGPNGSRRWVDDGYVDRIGNRR